MRRPPRPEAKGQTAVASSPMAGGGPNRADLNDRLWIEFNRERSVEARNRLVVRYLRRANWLLGKIWREKPCSIPFEDLQSLVHEELIKLVERFEPWREVNFWTFAEKRIRGTVTDAMRAATPGGRGWRDRIGEREGAEARLSQTLGRQPTEQELLEELGWTHEKVSRSRRIQIESLTRYLRQGDSFELDVASAFHSDRARRTVGRRVFERITRDLDIEEQVILYLYFFKDQTMGAIGGILGVCESAVSIRLAGILEHLREERSKSDTAVEQ
jgi:RNA polymerase sigma factor for flagellar operon FliA